MEFIIKQLEAALSIKLDQLTQLNILNVTLVRPYDIEINRWKMVSCVSDIQLIRNAILDLRQMITDPFL